MDYKKLFIQIVSYFLVPLGILGMSWIVQRQYKMKQNAGIDLFSFTSALDLSFLITQVSGGTRLNPYFHDIAGGVFGCALLVSLFFLGYSVYTQSLILEQLKKRSGYYPSGKVWLCWTVGLTAIGFHVWAILGG